MDLPYSLIKRCRNLFLNCREFESYENLRATFVSTELRPFRPGLKDASSPEARVDLFIDYILERTLLNGRSAFPVFLATLRDRYEEDALQEQLTQLLMEIEAHEQTAQAATAKPSISPQDLHEKLMALDFRPQARLFKDTTEQHRVAAFLVHGPPEHGQRLLTRRLIQSHKEWATGQRIVIDASSNGIGKSVRALWRQVAEKLGMPYDTDRRILADKVCEWWKTQDVIFIFLTVDYIPEDILSTWLDDFWKPIAATARQRQALTPSHTYLLLLLVDFSENVCKTKITLLDQPEDLLKTHAPLKLPPTGKIREDDLEYWLDTPPMLPGKVNPGAWLSDTENGVPELLYEKIFAYCGLTWEGEKLL
jgi:hypothetical protein